MRQGGGGKEDIGKGEEGEREGKVGGRVLRRFGGHEREFLIGRVLYKPYIEDQGVLILSSCAVMCNMCNVCNVCFMYIVCNV